MKKYVIQSSPTCFEVVRAFQYGEFVHIRVVEADPQEAMSEVAVIHLDDKTYRVHKDDLFDSMSDAYWSALEAYKIAMSDIRSMRETLEKRESALYNLRYQMKMEAY